MAERVLRTVDALDDRLGTTGFARRAMRKAFPDHWSFLLGEIALYAFLVLLASGVFLTLFFKPGMTEVVYDGSYAPLRGVRMSEAYASTLHISMDVRGGLLMRQVHHWAALLFVAAIMAHMLRVFFTGAFRKPRELNWLFGIVLFTLAMANGFTGYSLPDDLLSGTGLRLIIGGVQAVPVVGTYLAFFLLGGEFPGTDLVPRLYVLHVLLIPGLMAALVPVHALVLPWVQKHTDFRRGGSTERTVEGKPFYPVFMAKTGAFLLFTAGVIVLLGAVAQINPVWLYGPYSPSAISAGSQPDWYLAFGDGALRLMPGWDVNVAGHTVALGVLVPLLVITVFFTLLALYPFLEQRVTGDRAVHHVLDRPRDAATRTGVGVAGIVFYGVLWAAAGNDVIADRFHVSLFATTWFFRAAVFVGPVVAFSVTRRICLGLQRRDRALVEHGLETGIILRSPAGGYSERVRPLPVEEVERIRRPVPAGEPSRPSLGDYSRR
ncbi:menaquinol-cytochrome c reductase cytochrome b subunit precursor [Actinomadura meyerae]|jgi:ubiquinol-cytochrome c reductase cytochrome b subunit|uniref:Cytochrome bc1 complex cytochrome b subunit n=1 Tax=Actinomadura meyerae TaxID=240840 RepID=A0A239I4G7_9ACTN|nr:ubiquinol-cytochrome c reductase cytochrome b subunit [Actinomadura meyerae]SNS88178.1 menaquinol-cytochrome c reductase cytochrome b subunit precursor [Actinomadura meyerae]